MQANESSKMHSDITKVIKTRRTTHEFVDEKIPDELIEHAIELARWAPNHKLSQPWRFYLLGENAKHAISKANYDLVYSKRGAKAAEIKMKRWLAVPGWFVLTSQKSSDFILERENYAACCCAAQNVMLGLWKAGIGVKWTTGSVTRHSSFCEVVGFDPGVEEVVGMFWYGKPVKIVEQRRKPVADFLFRVP